MRTLGKVIIIALAGVGALFICGIILVGLDMPTSQDSLRPITQPRQLSSGDEAYILYMAKVAENEMRDFLDTVKFFIERVEADSLGACVWTSKLEDVTKSLRDAVQGAPQPQHSLLKKNRNYMLEAMEKELDSIRYLDKGCSSLDSATIQTAVLYQKQTYDLLSLAGDALEEYEAMFFGQ